MHRRMGQNGGIPTVAIDYAYMTDKRKSKGKKEEKEDDDEEDGMPIFGAKRETRRMDVGECPSPKGSNSIYG